MPRFLVLASTLYLHKNKVSVQSKYVRLHQLWKSEGNLTGSKGNDTVPRKLLLHLICYTRFGDAVVKSLPKSDNQLAGPLGCVQWLFFVCSPLEKMDHFCSKAHAHRISRVSFKCKMSLLRFWVLKYLWSCIGTFTQLYLHTVKFPWFLLNTL